MSGLKCRFYENVFPDVEETVVVNVRQIADMGAYVALSEYNNIEGMILLSELSRRRIRSVNKLIRVGRSECVVVIRVDQEKGYIDLSKRRVYTKDQDVCVDRFSKAKAVNSILRHVAEQLGYTEDAQLEELYMKTAWYFDRKEKKKAAAHDVFKKAITNPEVLDECDITPEIKEKLLEDIRKKLTPQAVRIRADIEVSCFAYDGIDAIKAALIAGKTCSTEELPIKINLIAAPHFVVTTQSFDKDSGLASVQKALDIVKETIEKHGGKFVIKEEARVISDIDEAEMKRKLEQAEQDALDDDEDSDDEDEEGSGDEEGMQAPKGLDQQVDAEEASRDAKKKEKKAKESGDEESD